MGIVMSFELEQIKEMIYVVAGHKVMLDSDLAKLYGVETSALNQAVKRNLKRFPQDFMFRLSSKRGRGGKQK
jgi:hypothetical protein